MPNCACAPLSIQSCPPYANLNDTLAAINRVSQCCKGTIINATNPLLTPAAALLEGFPAGVPSAGCGCDILWLIKPNGSTYMSSDNGVSFCEVCSIVPEALYAQAVMPTKTYASTTFNATLPIDTYTSPIASITNPSTTRSMRVYISTTGVELTASSLLNQTPSIAITPKISINSGTFVLYNGAAATANPSFDSVNACPFSTFSFANQGHQQSINIVPGATLTAQLQREVFNIRTFAGGTISAEGEILSLVGDLI